MTKVRRRNTLVGSVRVKQLKAVDRVLFREGRRVEILERLRWSKKVERQFLKDWHKGNRVLPRVTLQRRALIDQRETLRDIIRSVDAKDPIGKLLRETAQNFYIATRMVESVGTRAFLTYSARLYGLPTDIIGPKKVSTQQVARRMLRSAGAFDLTDISPAEDVCLLPEYVANQIRKVVRKKFKGVPFAVQVDPKLTAKASAGPDRIRVRGGTCFAHYDIEQLIAHELLVHSLTILNGRKQPYKVFGLNSPRTTCTQEGLAVFAEFVTGSIDINRLQRISARVQAIQMGIDGADFLEVFEFFLGQRQSEQEAYHSTMRIFRGGRIKGGVVFTKDQVYFKGFIEVHRFLMESLRTGHYQYPLNLFAGRMRTADVPLVTELIAAGILKEPHYEPDWVESRSTLLAFLLSSSIMSTLGLA